MKNPNIMLIAAYDHNRLIGNNNRLPWHLPNDLNYFRKTTRHKPVIMGRATYDSIGKALPQRRNIVLTRDCQLQLPDAECFDSVEAALAAVKNEPDVFVIGGAQIYALFLPIATHLYITHIEGNFKGDAYFPDWDQRAWQLISEEKHTQDATHDCDYRFCVYTKRI